MMNEHLYERFLFFVYIAFNPPVHSSLIFKNKNKYKNVQDLFLKLYSVLYFHFIFFV